MTKKKISNVNRMIDKYQKYALIIFGLFSIIVFINYSSSYGRPLTVQEMQTQLFLMMGLFIIMLIFALLVIINLVYKTLYEE